MAKQVPGSRQAKVARKPAAVPRAMKNGSNSRFWIVGVLALAFFAFIPVLKSEFINYDDDIYVTENPLIRNLDARELFTSFYLNQYSPLSMLIMGLEFRISDEPGFIKMMSLIFHLLVTFVLYRFLSSVFDRKEFAIIPAMLFAIHPMHAESVAWTAASMKIGPYALFFLLSLWMYVRYLKEKSKVGFVLSLIFFLCSCLSKEQALVLPGAMIALDLFMGRRLSDKKVWIEKLPFFALALFFAFITMKASSSGGAEVRNAVVQYGLFDRLLLANYTLFAYFFKSIFPAGLSAFVVFPLPDEIGLLHYLSLAGTVLLAYAIFQCFRKDEKFILLGIFFFLINLLLPILSQLMGARDVMMADRYAYLPLVGFGILFTCALLWLKEKFRISESLVAGIAVVYSLSLAVGAYGRSVVWHDSASVFTDVIEKGENNGKYSPYLSLPFNNRGIALKKQGNLDAALADYKKAAEINPSDPKSYANIGNIYFDRGEAAAAIPQYNRSLSINPSQAVAYSSRGAAYGMLGKMDSALADLSRSIELDPGGRNTYMNRSLVYFNTGKYAEALQDVNAHMQVSPGDKTAYGQRGLIYLNMGKATEALNDLNAVISFLPALAPNYLNRSLVYKELGNKSAAMQDALKAREMGMQVSDDYLNSLK